MRLVLVGPPGSGKGTQAKRLIKTLSLTYIGTGDILREAIRQRSPVGLEAEPLIKQGLLVPDPLVNEMVADLFRSDNRPARFVLDGYPRTYAQAIAFDALLRQVYSKLDAVINLAIADDEVVERISYRRVCSNPKCAAPYHLHAQKPKQPDVCDLCGSSLICREDDREETVRRRLVEFHKNTDTLLEHYERQDLVKHISALDPVDTIFDNILKSLPMEHPPRMA
ncbi:MAG: adenylate kinase [Fimbriiglobus sp.]